MPDDVTTEKTTIGPYILGEREKGMTVDKINAMPPKQQEITYQNIQTINIHMAALGESLEDETIGDTPLMFDGENRTLDEIIRVGKTMPDADKLQLVRQVMNQNVTYTPPELDPFVERRESAPLKEIGDYAQTTRETLTSGIGDCEDWAIAQADMLVRMGIPPENLQIMSGTVYNTNDDTQFDHANLAVKTSDNKWNVMELGNGKVFVAPETYLDNGIEGYHFMPNMSISGEGAVSQFKINPDTPATPTSKQGFTSSTSDYGLGDDKKKSITSEAAFNRAASGIPRDPDQGMEIIDPTLQQKAAQNAASYLNTGTNGP
jgi:hypothetical protein